MELTKKQQEGLEIVCAKYQAGERYAVIAGYAGAGKAQPNDTLIPTPNGYKLLKNLKIGDKVFDRLGKSTTITGIFPQGEKEVFEVTLKDGRKTLCNNEHIFSCYNQNKTCFVNKTVKQIMEQGLLSSNGSYKHFIPLNGPVEYPHKELKVDPYVMGCFLGDGYCVSSALAFSSSDEEIVENIAKKINSPHYKKKAENEFTWFFEKPLSQQTDRCFLYSTKDIFSNFSDEVMQYSENKRIPQEYLLGSIEQRWELLRGLMDTDGSINTKEKYHTLRFCSVSEKLIKDVITLINSLGYTCSVYKDVRKNKYPKTGVCYSLSLSVPNKDKPMFFNLKRKKDIAILHQNEQTRKRFDCIPIINIKKLEYTTEMTCIMVDNEEHLYLTNDFITTHNTTLIAHIVSKLKEKLELTDESFGFCSLTGKAAQVLSNNGNPNATTIHKLIYKTKVDKQGRYHTWKIKDLPYKVVVCDECSMVSNTIINDLLSFRDTFFIFCGDPEQLPSVTKDDSNTLLDSPDVFLDEIMRQAAESGIIQMSMKIRHGEGLKGFESHDAKVIPKAQYVNGMLDWADIAICATNKTRQALNEQYRAMKGYTEPLVNGEKVICYRNYWDVTSDNENALTNGCVGYLYDFYEGTRNFPPWCKISNLSIPVIYARFVTEWGDDFGELCIDKKFFFTGEKSLTPQEEYSIRKYGAKELLPLEFTYSYAITAWKAQGSQWGKVLVFEESFPYDSDEHRKFLYTAVTRAEDKVVLLH